MYAFESIAMHGLYDLCTVEMHTRMLGGMNNPTHFETPRSHPRSNSSSDGFLTPRSTLRQVIRTDMEPQDMHWKMEDPVESPDTSIPKPQRQEFTPTSPVDE